MAVETFNGGMVITGSRDTGLFGLMAQRYAVEIDWPNARRAARKRYGLKPRVSVAQILVAIDAAIASNRAQ